METNFGLVAPHEEAAGIIKGKEPVSRKVFAGLLPELRGRAFAVSGVEGAKVLGRIRDEIAALPMGSVWDDVKGNVASALEPYLGEGAETRATLLVRTHGFQAFQASNWRVAQEDEDTTHLQYLATEDDRVRDSHLALNGIVLPKSDPFWDSHMPPWEWNCRCRIRAMNPDAVDEERARDEKRNPEDRNVVEGVVADQLRNGTLMRGTRRFDVTPPKDGPEGQAAYQWHPDDLRLPVGDIAQRYDSETFGDFAHWARNAFVRTDLTVWNWLLSKPVKPLNGPLGREERKRQDARTIRARIGRERKDEDLPPSSPPPIKPILPPTPPAPATVKPVPVIVPAAPAAPVKPVVVTPKPTPAAVPVTVPVAQPFDEHFKVEEIRLSKLRSHEQATLYGADGKVLLKKKGGRRSVGFTEEELKLMKGGTLTHNHPGGSSFSMEDLVVSAFHGLREVIAVGVAAPFTYRARPRSGVWPSARDLRASYTAADSRAYVKYNELVRNGAMSPTEAGLAHRHEVMLEVAEKHDLIYERIKRQA